MGVITKIFTSNTKISIVASNQINPLFAIRVRPPTDYSTNLKNCPSIWDLPGLTFCEPFKHSVQSKLTV